MIKNLLNFYNKNISLNNKEKSFKKLNIKEKLLEILYFKGNSLKKFNNKEKLSLNLNNKGQLSLEYIISIMMVILIITLVTIPLLSITIDYSKDIIDSLNAKNELNKIADAIDFSYNSGKGSKRIVLVNFNQDVNIHFTSNSDGGFAYLNLNLSDSSKRISVDYDCSSLNSNIQLSKGFHKILVEWNDDSGLMEVSKLV